ncbi:MAG: hypothetical protein J7604_24975 [Sporocytophaga sp.]|uniref:hypothetical protein n=1 Tax=Sporocytophaga sp. TaxID=2231183 RepID=UPI001B0E08A8|nr:hypothetical protein [Sporocytophaga sp.]MBO9703485.1 hypothetical protein [Sporocytophaga sp.]
MLETFVDSYKYHVTGLFLELLPLFLMTGLCSFLFKKSISTQKFIWIFLKLTGTSIAGYLSAEMILFFQWYWYIAPEYRNIPGDMLEGLGFRILYSIIWFISIVVSYLIILNALKSFTKPKANSSLIQKSESGQ